MRMVLCRHSVMEDSWKVLFSVVGDHLLGEIVHFVWVDNCSWVRP